MPTREWKKYLAQPGFEILVRIVTRRGRLERFAAVLMHDGEDITRYDNAHDVPHRDILGRKIAFIRKEWYAKMNTEEALEHALNDLTENCQKYWEFYNSH